MNTHGSVPIGLECLAEMELITKETYVEYKSMPSGIWKPSLFSKAIIRELHNTQFTNYMKAVQAPDCKAELKRLLIKGPPIYISDKHALPLGDGDTYISTLWFAEEDVEESAVLTGAVQGDARQTLWNDCKLLLTEDDDDNDEA